MTATPETPDARSTTEPDRATPVASPDADPPTGVAESPATSRGTLTVVVPLRDEFAGVPALAERLRRFADQDCRFTDESHRRVDWVLVDDGSVDGTSDRLAACFGGDLAPRTTVVHHDRPRGLTTALATGAAAATGQYVAWLDADLTYDPALLAELANELDADRADVGIASCYHPAGNVVGVPKWRLALSRAISRAYRRVSRHRELHTFTCMVRVYRREVLAECAPERGGFVGVTEVLLRALAAGYRVVEIPATLHRRRLGASKMRVVRVGLAHLGLLWAARGGRSLGRSPTTTSNRLGPGG